MPATMNISSMITGKLFTVSSNTWPGVVIPRMIASMAINPPGCSG